LTDMAAVDNSSNGPTVGLMADPSVDVLLVDGTVATIRPLLPTDRLAVIGLHEAASDDSLRSRFFTVSRIACRTYAEHLCATTDGPRPFSLAAFVSDELVGVASAEPVAAGLAEIAVLVADHAHGLGLGTLLVEHLAAAGRERGVRSFVAEVLSDNQAMLRVFRDCGFDVVRSVEGGTHSLRLDTAATTRAVAAADHRECHAEANSLKPLLYPQSVAVVGARRDGSGVGNAVLQAIRAGGYRGDVHVVHRGLTALDGVAAVPSFSALDHPVDLAIIAVPAEDVVATAQEAVEAGVRAAVVLSSGFGEMGEGGAERQRELVRVARRHSMRVVGPNCLGVMSTDPTVSLNATFTDALPQTGGLAIATQSGGVGIALLELAREAGLGVASFVSLGNKADVSGNDLLAAWLYDDPRQRRGAGAGRRFLCAAPLGGNCYSGAKPSRVVRPLELRPDRRAATSVADRARRGPRDGSPTPDRQGTQSGMAELARVS
jgi:ribosomal protein S18 acetylase RimI-like enzyme/predicted CoA-binding protein